MLHRKVRRTRILIDNKKFDKINKEDVAFNIINEVEDNEWEYVENKVKSSNNSEVISFVVNDIQYEFNNLSPETTLAECLRDILHLTGTKIGCNEGGCGSCTVVITDNNGEQFTANSCLRLAYSCNNMKITTIEGIGTPDKPHKIQKALYEADGSQCGFCSPGFVMSMYDLLETSKTVPTELDVEHNFDGHICRCTGYRSILSGMKSLVSPSGKKHECKIGECLDIEDCIEPSHSKKTSPVRIRNNKNYDYTNSSPQWLTPANLTDLLNLIKEYSNVSYQLVVGNTGHAVSKYYTNEINKCSVYINVLNVSALSIVSGSDAQCIFGACITLTKMIETFKSYKGYDPLINHLNIVANKQVRNVASWAGNFMLKHQYPNFASDVVTMLAAANSMVTIMRTDNSTNTLSVFDFLNFDMTECVIVSIEVNSSNNNNNMCYFDTWKVGERHENSHAYVNAGFKFEMSSNNLINNVYIAIDGLGALFAPTKTIANLIGKSLSSDNLLNSIKIYNEEVNSLSNDSYLTFLATSLYYKFLLSVLNQQTPSPVPTSLLSAFEHYQRSVSKGVETYEVDEKESPVSLPIHKLTALEQTCGTAKYTDDEFATPDCLEAAYVLAPKVGKLISIDISKAIVIDGVEAVITAKDIVDIGGSNNCGIFPGDEEIFASKTINYAGQPVALVCANSRSLAIYASKLITVNVETTGVVLIPDMKTAIKANSYLKDNQYIKHIPQLQRGNVDEGLKEADFVVTGTATLGSQYHFYMETHSILISPIENGAYLMKASTQGASYNKTIVATALQIPANKLIVETKRVGGGFGGKSTRQAQPTAAVAVACKKLQVPIRMQIERQTDMQTQGLRSATYCSQYTIGLKKTGKILAFEAQMYNQGGMSYDQTLPNMDILQMTMDNVYNVPNWLTKGSCCATNTPPSTACRSPGLAAAKFYIENALEKLAFVSKMDENLIRESNFYKVGDSIVVGQKLEYCSLQQVWSQLKAQADFDNRLAAVKDFNSKNRFRKRGIKLLPNRHAEITWQFYNGICIINICAEDGSIQITSGGVEMGQGLNTKVAQVVAYELGVDLSTIEVLTTSTEKVPNMTTTDGSGTSEVMCHAAIDACKQVNTALEPYRQKKPSATFSELIAAAAADFVNLSFTGHWAMAQAPTNEVVTYFIWAGACAEVEVDILTGQVEILQVDIVYDCGISLNNGLDMGQIEGGFVMGLGHFFSEDVLQSEDGLMLNAGTWLYKPPEALDIPINFNVTFLKNTPNQSKYACLSSKAVGEPPFELALSAFFAVKQALQSARDDLGINEYLELSPPATVPKIQTSVGLTVDNLNLNSN